jgi:hypothetical protein
MNTRQTLHELVDQLPDEQLTSAVRVLKGLEAVSDDWTILLANVPIDDEPFDPSDLEGDDDEPSVPHEEIVRNFARELPDRLAVARSQRPPQARSCDPRPRR